MQGDSAAKKELELLNVRIRARIEDFDNFYAEHFQDYRLPYFEKQKYRLRRLIADSMRLDPNIEEGVEFPVITPTQADELRPRGRSRTKSFKSTTSDIGKEQIRKVKNITQHEHKDDGDNEGFVKKSKNALIQGSISRLFPSKAKKTEPKIATHKDLVFTIKMSPEEFNNFNQTKELYRTIKKVKL